MTPKNICFISIFDLTILQYEIAARLSERGHACYWMTTDPKWTAWLLEKGVARERILELVFDRSAFLDADARARTVRRIVASEAHTPFTANMSLLADRFVLSKNDADINEYACLYHYHAQAFLAAHRIDIVFGEPTNTNELLTAMICAEMRLPFLYPQSLRFPDRRFYFELGVASGRMVASGREKGDPSAREMLEKYRLASAHPDYFYRNNRQSLPIGRALRSLSNRIKGAVRRKDNLTHYRFAGQLVDRARTALNRFRLLRLHRYSRLEDIPGKLAYFGLHVQPEASIDVLGPYYSDQLKLIKDMRRALPFDTTLVVKEHPNFLGKKPMRFFRELRRLPNVRLVHPHTSSFDIYKRADLVLTVSGTIAYEAGMLRIPAITFTPMYFAGFANVHYCPDITRLKPLAFGLLETGPIDSPGDAGCMQAILRDSHPGYWIDPFNDPSVLEPSNLEALADGFIDAIEHVDHRKLVGERP